MVIYQTFNRVEARRFAERLADRGYNTDLVRDPSSPSRHQVTASFEGDAPDISDILSELPTMEQV